ncbi:MAG: hypothetical protein KAR20_15360 [Candidatus Heimdallarchaeota archaeon]|nr:hypothetical protein [Candidatus Heimdallarchaeota archaeon]
MKNAESEVCQVGTKDDKKIYPSHKTPNSWMQSKQIERMINTNLWIEQIDHIGKIAIILIPEPV